MLICTPLELIDALNNLFLMHVMGGYSHMNVSIRVFPVLTCAGICSHVGHVRSSQLPAALREVAMTLALVANRLEMRAPLTHSRLPCLPWNTCWATVLQFLRAPDFPAFELRRAVEGWSVREPMLIEAR